MRDPDFLRVTFRPRRVLWYALAIAGLGFSTCPVEGQVDCRSLCENIYPSIVGIFPAPVIFFSDSVLGPQPWPDDVLIGFRYRLVAVECETDQVLRLEKVEFRTEEGLLRTVVSSFELPQLKLPNFSHRGSADVTWIDPTTAEIQIGCGKCTCYRIEVDSIASATKVIELTGQ